MYNMSNFLQRLQTFNLFYNKRKPTNDTRKLPFLVGRFIARAYQPDIYVILTYDILKFY